MRAVSITHVDTGFDNPNPPHDAFLQIDFRAADRTGIPDILTAAPGFVQTLANR